jgi:hypothetical protein
MSSQSLGSWPADAGLLRPKLPPDRISAGGNSHAAQLGARPCPVTRVGENQSVIVKSLDRIHSPTVRKWTPHPLLRSTNTNTSSTSLLANDGHLRFHNFDSHSTPITRSRRFPKALLIGHSCLVINYIATDRYTHNPKVGGSNPSPATIQTRISSPSPVTGLLPSRFHSPAAT